MAVLSQQHMGGPVAAHILACELMEGPAIKDLNKHLWYIVIDTSKLIKLTDLEFK